MKKEIDTITFDYKVLKETTPDQITERPDVGSYIYGLFLEAANWNSEKEFLEEAAPKVLYNKMPLIWLIPVQISTTKDNTRRVL